MGITNSMHEAKITEDKKVDIPKEKITEDKKVDIAKEKITEDKKGDITKDETTDSAINMDKSPETKIEEKEDKKDYLSLKVPSTKQMELTLAGDFEAIMGIYYSIFEKSILENSDIRETLEKFYKDHAEKGNADAQNIYGWIFEFDEDYEQAFEWYSLSAEQGNSWAMNSLSDLYNQGDYVEEDWKKVCEFALKSYEKGNFFATSNLGDSYYFGHGVKQDHKKAFELYSEGAKHGVWLLYESLGNMYLEGKGTERDPKMAQHYFKKAIEFNDLDGAIALAKMYIEGNGVEHNSMTALEYCLNYDYDEDQLVEVNGIIIDIIRYSDNPRSLLKRYMSVKRLDHEINP